MRDERRAPLQRGTNQAGMRAHNERLVLSLVRRHGALAKTEIARMTGLSAQTVSVIMRHLEADRLLRRGEPQRGRVGQPSVPLSLDPEGAFFLGAKIGRRSLDVVLVDFVGGDPPPRDRELSLSRRRATRSRASGPGSKACEAALGARAERIAGLGLAMPFELWNWAEEIGAPAAEMAAWRRIDIRAELAAPAALPGLPAERRHRRLRRRARLRRQRRAAGLHLFLRRRLHRRRAGAERRALHRAHRQRRGARLDAGARRRGRHGAADRPRLAGAARAPAARRRRCRPTRSTIPTPTGAASARISTTGWPPPRAASPTPSPRPRRSSTSRRR